MNLIESWKRIGELLPMELVLKECFRHGVEAIELRKHLFSIPGSYGEKIIAIDPDADRRQIIRTIRRRHGLDIGSDEVFIWIFFHELFHCIQEKRDPRADLNSGKMQAEAERWALEKFIEYRLGRERRR